MIDKAGVAEHEWTITTDTLVRAGLVIAAAYLLFILRGIVLIVLASLVIASALEPYVEFFLRRKFSRGTATLVVFAGFFLFLALILVVALPAILSDASSFSTSLPLYIDQAFTQFAQHINSIGAPAFSADSVLASMNTSVRDGLSVSGAWNAASGIFGAFFSIVITLVLSFYFAATGEMERFIEVITPNHYSQKAVSLWKRSQDKIGNWLLGQLTLALIMGIVVFFGLTILGIPHPLSLALISAVCEIVPVVGPLFAAVPPLILAAVVGGWPLFIATLIFYILAQQLENHVIYPQIVSRIVGIPPILVILSLLVGGSLAGIAGLLLAVPLAGVGQELVAEWRKHT